MLVKDGQKTTSNRLRKIRHFFRFIFGLSRFGKARTTLNALVRTIYIPPFAKGTKDGGETVRLSVGYSPSHDQVISTIEIDG